MGSRHLQILIVVLVAACATIKGQCSASTPKFYWFNSVTGVTQWEEPPQWELYGADGKVYYLAEDGEKVSEKPDKYAWKELVSDEHDGAKYYFNEKTGVTTWTPPEHLAWVQVSTDGDKQNGKVEMADDNEDEEEDAEL